MEHEDMKDLRRAAAPDNPDFADAVLRAAFAHKRPAVTWQSRLRDAWKNWRVDIARAPRKPAYAFAAIALLAITAGVAVDPSSFGIQPRSGITLAAADNEEAVELALYDMWGTF